MTEASLSVTSGTIMLKNTNANTSAENEWSPAPEVQWLHAVPASRYGGSNTLVVSAASAALAVLVMLLTSYAVMRTRLSGRGLLDLLTWVAVTVPGIVLAIGMTWANLSFVRLPFPFFGTLAILILAVPIILLLTLGRLMNGTMVQISAELEESARVQGASFQLCAETHPAATADTGRPIRIPGDARLRDKELRDPVAAVHTGLDCAVSTAVRDVEWRRGGGRGGGH